MESKHPEEKYIAMKQFSTGIYLKNYAFKLFLKSQCSDWRTVAINADASSRQHERHYGCRCGIMNIVRDVWRMTSDKTMRSWARTRREFDEWENITEKHRLNGPHYYPYLWPRWVVSIKDE